MYSAQAKSLFEKLKSAGLIGAEAQSTFELLGVSLASTDRNVVGYLLQAWLSEWMLSNQIKAHSPENSQESPDFFLSSSEGESLLELKTFDADRSANFDISNFEAYVQLICDDPAHLDADYLIMGYRIDDDGKLTISDLWLKKVWEITGSSAAYPLKVQQKRNVIYNIRPVTWMSARSTYPPFNSRDAFLKAIYWTINVYRGSAQAESWRVEFSNATGRTLVI